MLIYEKLVDGIRKLFGNFSGNIPTEADEALTYKDLDGDVIEDLSLNDTYLDDGHGGIIRKSDGKFIAVNIGEHNVIPGKDFEYEEKVFEELKFNNSKTVKVNYTVGDTISLKGVKVLAVFKSGEEEDVTSECTFSPAAGETVTADMSEITATYTYDEVEKSVSYTIHVTE